MELNRQIQSPNQRKAYLMGLCLCAQKVLADIDGGEQATGEVKAEKELLDQVMEALQEPSAEHMQIYMGLGVALAVVAGILFMALGGGKGKEQTITLSELEDVAPSAPKGKKAKAAVAKKAKKVEEDDGWEDDEHDSASMLKEIDQLGGFTKTMEGTLEPADMIKLRRIIGKYAYKSFMPVKEEMMNKRLALFKAKNWQAYTAQVQDAAKQYQKINFEVTKLAAEHLDIDEVNFEASMKIAMQDKGTLEQIKKDDEGQRIACEPKKDVSKDLAKRVLLEKIQLEFESERKLASFQPRNQQEAQIIVLIERTKVMDQLYLKHGVKLVDLQRAERDFDLENDDDIKKCKAANLAAREQQAKAKMEEMKSSLKPSDDQASIIKEVCADMGTIDAAPGINGQMNWEEYIKVFRCVVSCQIKFSKKIEEDCKEERLAALDSGDKQAYAKACQMMIMSQQKAKQGATLGVLDELKIEPELYDKTGRASKGSPESTESMKQASVELDKAEREKTLGPDFVPLEKEAVLQHIEQIEMSKVGQMAGALVAVQMGQMPQQQLPLIEQIAKVQAFDALWKQHQVTESHITHALSHYDLIESAAFKSILDRAQNKMKETMQRAQMQIQQMMAARGGMGGRGMGRGGMPPGMGRGMAPGMGRGGMPGGAGARGPPAPQGPPGGGAEQDAADLGW